MNITRLRDAGFAVVIVPPIPGVDPQKVEDALWLEAELMREESEISS